VRSGCSIQPGPLRQFPQYRIDQPYSIDIARLPGEFHAFKDSGMRWDAIEQQKLQGSQLKRNLHRVGQVAPTSGKRSTDTLLQRELPSQHSHDQGCRQISVERRQCFHPFGTKQRVTVQLRLPAEFKQQLEGSASGWGDRAALPDWSYSHDFTMTKVT